MQEKIEHSNHQEKKDGIRKMRFNRIGLYRQFKAARRMSSLCNSRNFYTIPTLFHSDPTNINNSNSNNGSNNNINNSNNNINNSNKNFADNIIMNSHDHIKDERIRSFIKPFSTPELIEDATITELNEFIGDCYTQFDLGNTPELYPTLYQALSKCAREGIPEALLILANMYATGTFGLNKDIEASFKYFLEAAERGNAQAQFYVAKFYMHAYNIILMDDVILGVEKKSDFLEELSFHPSVVKDGDNFIYLDESSKRKLEASEKRRAKTNYSNYPGLSKKTISTKLKESKKLAYYYIKKSADNGHSMAQLLLANMHFRGEVEGDADIKLAFSMLQKAAEQDEPDALYNLGLLYYNGVEHRILPPPMNDGSSPPVCPTQGKQEEDIAGELFVIEKDINKALECFLKAAELGEPVAVYWVGYSYLNGQHLKKDLKRGLEMVQRACDLDHPQALYCMYLMYLEGHEAVSKDPVKADAMLKAAMKAHSGDALFDMADRCFHGTHGEEKNMQRALKLYEDAGRVRHGAALYCAATMYYYGMGTARNLELAYERYTQAATAGYEDALVSVAKMTLKGEGVEKNEPYARYLLSELKNRGIPFDEKDFE